MQFGVHPPTNDAQSVQRRMARERGGGSIGEASVTDVNLFQLGESPKIRADLNPVCLSEFVIRWRILQEGQRRQAGNGRHALGCEVCKSNDHTPQRGMACKLGECGIGEMVAGKTRLFGVRGLLAVLSGGVSIRPQ